MSRLEIPTPIRAQVVVEGLYRDLERRIESSPPGLCPVDYDPCLFLKCVTHNPVANVFLAVSVSGS